MKQTIITSSELRNYPSGTRRVYNSPCIEIIKLDNEISLALASDPPVGPGEASNITPDQFNNNPFNDRIVSS